MRRAVLCVMLVAGCGAYDDLPLLEVDAIEPPQLEPGATIRVHGSGFPLGRTPQILLRGSMNRPGHPVRGVEAKLVGLVRSESLIEVPVRDEVFDAVGGRATIDGELRVSFRSADRLRDIFAAERVRVDFLPDTASQLRIDGVNEPREEPSRSGDFGFELSQEELGTVGVSVVTVDRGGLAARQGVKPGDLVVGLDGVSVYGWRDFVPDPSRTESIVLVSREGLRGVHALRWPHEATEPVIDPFALVLFGLLGFLLGWCSPIGLCIRTRPTRVTAAAWVTRSTLMLAFSALMLFVPTLQWTTMWILMLGTFAAVFALATRDRIGTSSFAYAIGAALVIMLIARTASIAEIVAAQELALSRWYVFQTPASSLAFCVYLVALGQVASRARLSASLYAAPTAVLGAVLFLGGWPVASSPAGIAILVAKALVLLGAAHAIEMRSRVATVILACSLGLAFAGVFVDLGGAFSPWSALAVGAACALAVRVLVPPLRQAEAPVPA